MRDTAADRRESLSERDSLYLSPVMSGSHLATDAASALTGHICKSVSLLCQVQ